MNDLKDIASKLLAKLILPYAKAWVVLVVNALVRGLGYFGLDAPVEVVEPLNTALTAFVVWLVPNVPNIKK